MDEELTSGALATHIMVDDRDVLGVPSTFGWKGKEQNPPTFAPGVDTLLGPEKTDHHHPGSSSEAWGCGGLFLWKFPGLHLVQRVFFVWGGVAGCCLRTAQWTRASFETGMAHIKDSHLFWGGGCGCGLCGFCRF